MLIALGLVMKRKDVFGGRSKSLVRLEKPSHSALAKLNDKNLDSNKWEKSFEMIDILLLIKN